jgi:nucleotide-binding universal stress UspA family protein
MNLDGPVLVATDLSEGGDEAVRQGEAQARVGGVPLIVCHVMPELLSLDPLFPQLRLKDALATPEVERRAAEAVEGRVATLVGRRPGEVALVMATGSAHASILDLAEQKEAGLLVVGARGAGGGTTALVLGSVAERVVRHALCPVLVARPSPPRGKVVAATDFSDPALPAPLAGTAEARRRGVPVVLVHCMDLLPPGVIGYEVPPISAEVVAGMRQHWEQRLEEALVRFGAKDIGSYVLVEGPAGAMIVETARVSGAGLVVVGTHGRTGLRRLVLGSVAEAVVRNAPCSVLVVRLADAPTAHHA